MGDGSLSQEYNPHIITLVLAEWNHRFFRWFSHHDERIIGLDTLKVWTFQWWLSLERWGISIFVDTLLGMSLWFGPFQNGHVHFLSGRRLRRLGCNEKKLRWKVGARFDRTDHCDRKHASHGGQDDCKGHFVSSVSTSPATKCFCCCCIQMMSSFENSWNFNSHIGRVLAKMMPMENLFRCYANRFWESMSQPINGTELPYQACLPCFLFSPTLCFSHWHRWFAKVVVR